MLAVAPTARVTSKLVRSPDRLLGKRQTSHLAFQAFRNLVKRVDISLL